MGRGERMAGEWPGLAAETQRIWEGLAAFWDGRMGEGNAFHLALVGPAAERLLGPVDGMEVLDIACGNGQFSRRLAELGALVTATDFSPAFLELGQRRAAGTEYAERIAYQQVDATDEAQIVALGEGRFDAVVCNMALMDMATVGPLMRAAARVLKAGGRFVCTTMHPCFNSNPITLVLEREDRDGNLVDTYAVKVSRYRQPFHYRGLGMPGQPMPQYYFHRALTGLLTPAFEAGLVLDGLEEPVFGPEARSERVLGWGSYTDIPPVLAVRLRR